MQNVYSNLYSQAVTHPSTNRSRPCLTSVIGRELVHSRWYGRRHPSRGKILMQNLKISGTRFSDFWEMDSSSPILFVDLKTMNSYYLLWKYFYFAPRHFQNYKRQESWFKNPLPKVSIWGPRGEVAACCRRMALVTVTRASLKIVHFLAPANPQGQNIFWIRVIGGQKCWCFNFGFW